jgi:hypothetical protein
MQSCGMSKAFTKVFRRYARAGIDVAIVPAIVVQFWRGT